jgi:hemophore-related protein
MTFALKSVCATALVLGTGGALFGLATPAIAAPPPGCSLADVTNVAAGVDAAIAAYLFTHPDVNNFLSGLQGQNKDSVRAQVQSYFQTNPQVKAELDALRAPSVDLRNRCGIPAAAIILGVL